LTPEEDAASSCLDIVDGQIGNGLSEETVGMQELFEYWIRRYLCFAEIRLNVLTICNKKLHFQYTI
jgi:hypothetical protein